MRAWLVSDFGCWQLLNLCLLDVAFVLHRANLLLHFLTITIEAKVIMPISEPALFYFIGRACEVNYPGDPNVVMACLYPVPDREKFGRVWLVALPASPSGKPGLVNL